MLSTITLHTFNVLCNEHTTSAWYAQVHQLNFTSFSAAEDRYTFHCACCTRWWSYVPSSILNNSGSLFISSLFSHTSTRFPTSSALLSFKPVPTSVRQLHILYFYVLQSYTDCIAFHFCHQQHTTMIFVNILFCQYERYQIHISMFHRCWKHLASLTTSWGIDHRGGRAHLRTNPNTLLARLALCYVSSLLQARSQ